MTLSLIEEIEMPKGKMICHWKVAFKNFEVCITNLGVIISSIKFPSRDGLLGETVLGFNNVSSYLSEHPYFGALVGPVANRIRNATFHINDVEYSLDINENPNHLHGGSFGFSHAVWDYEIIDASTQVEFLFSYNRPDGLMGYPGNLDCECKVVVNEAGRIDIKYMVKTDKPTPVNLTHHEYFNLNNDHSLSIQNHNLQLNSKKITPTDSAICVTGEVLDVIDTPFDFFNKKNVGKALDELLKEQDDFYGFDHNFIINNNNIESATAVLEEEASGRRLTIYTSKPCIQLYTGFHLEGANGRNGTYKKLNGICLEPQGYPDAVNQPHWPSVILNPKKEYSHFTTYEFSTF